MYILGGQQLKRFKYYCPDDAKEQRMFEAA